MSSVLILPLILVTPMACIPMCRLGPMVAMFKYSKVATYSVALPPQKLDFGNSIKEEVLKKEFEDVSSYKNILLCSMHLSASICPDLRCFPFMNRFI